MGVKLHSYWRSSCSWRVRIGLALKDLEYEYVPVNLLDAEQRGDAFAAQSAMKQVPLLEVGPEFAMTQSLAILRYLEHVVPEPALFPQGRDGARALEIAEIINSGIQPLQNLSVLQYIESLGGDRAAWGKDVITRGFVAVERALEKSSGAYCIGDRVSVADLCLVPQVYNARRFDVDLSAFPNISAIDARCAKLDAFASAHPDQQPDAQKQMNEGVTR